MCHVLHPWSSSWSCGWGLPASFWTPCPPSGPRPQTKTRRTLKKVLDPNKTLSYFTSEGFEWRFPASARLNPRTWTCPLPFGFPKRLELISCRASEACYQTVAVDSRARRRYANQMWAAFARCGWSAPVFSKGSRRGQPWQASPGRICEAALPLAQSNKSKETQKGIGPKEADDKLWLVKIKLRTLRRRWCLETFHIRFTS